MGTTDGSPLACDRTALTEEQRQQHTQLAEQLARATTEVQELSDGYMFQYHADESMWRIAAEFVNLERRCCPFFSFALELEPDGGPVSLRLTGDKRVKEFLKAQIQGVVPTSTRSDGNVPPG